jgi:hypothetical protein
VQVKVILCPHDSGPFGPANYNEARGN